MVHNLDIVPSLSLGTLRDLKNVATSLWEEPKLAEEVVGRVIGLCTFSFRSKDHICASYFTFCRPSSQSLTKSKGRNGLVGQCADRAAISSVRDAVHGDLEDSTSREVPLSSSEIAGRSRANRALEPNYKDPALEGSDMSDDAELDWLWSLMKTLRAANDSDKLCEMLASTRIFTGV